VRLTPDIRCPAVLGIDMAGVVEAVGGGVQGFRPGDAVFGMTGGVGGIQGALAEYAAVDPALLAIKPVAFSMREAAATPLVFITAWEGLVDRVSELPPATPIHRIDQHAP
jgi:NADPH2:quinone reductase